MARPKRQALYGLTREHLQDLLILSENTSERKALVGIYYLCTFVQGKRRLPRSSELNEVLSDAIDRNLGKEEFSAKWNLDLQTEDQDLENPEEFYLETIEKLRLIEDIQRGWEGWRDGT
jgi:hypothetical protein